MRPNRAFATKLVLAFLIPTLILVGAMTLFVYFLARQRMEEELGQRLIAVARAVTAQAGIETALYLRPAEEHTRTYRNLHQKLVALQEATGVTGLTVFDANLKILASSHEGAIIGAPLYRASADRHEIEIARQTGAAASMMFVDRAGNYYKTGYAYLLVEIEADTGTRLEAFVAAEGSPAYFALLIDFGHRLLLMAGLLLAALVVIGLLFAKRVVQPIGQLVNAAQEITQGHLERPIAIPSRDEIGFLAQTMEEMRKAIGARDRQMQMMLAGIAHEVRNPLGGMELFAGLLAEDLAGEPERQAKVDKILKELRYLEQVVSDFLDFARKRPVEWGKVPLAALLRECAELCQTGHGCEQVNAAIAASDELIAPGDRRMLKRIFLNLIHNSAAAMPQGGLLRLSANRQEKEILCRVEDSGPGIPPDRREIVFEPFYTTKEKGSGLGLAFVKRMVEAHNGRVWLDESDLGGLRVNISLPSEPPDEGFLE